MTPESAPTNCVSCSHSLAQRYPQHGGVIVAVQQNWTLAELVSALDRLLSSTDAAGWLGRVRWLNEWRQK